MDDNKAILCLFKYLISFKDKYPTLTAPVFGRFKVSFKSEYEQLKKVTIDDILKTNFYTSMLKIFECYNTIVATQVFPFTIKRSPHFILLIQDFIDGKTSEICGTETFNKFDEIDIVILNTCLENYQNLEKEIENSVRSLTIINEISATIQTKSLPKDFKEASGLFRVQLEKASRNHNHINILKTHLESDPITVPKRLMYWKFPEPWLPYDPLYIEQYNILIIEFQKKAMEMSIKCCEERLKTNNEQLEKLKQNYKETPNLESLIEKIKNSIEFKTKKSYQEQSEAIVHLKPQYYKVIDNIDLTDVNLKEKSINTSNSRPSRRSTSTNNSNNRSNNTQINKRARFNSNHNHSNFNNNQSSRKSSNNNNNQKNSRSKSRNQRASTPNENSRRSRQNFHRDESFYDNY